MDAFEDALRKIQESQLRRLKNSKGTEAVLHFEKILREKNLTFADILQKVKDELLRVCKITQLPDEIMETSQPRLNGFGWSVPRIQKHMDVFFKEILENYSTTLKKAIQTEIET